MRITELTLKQVGPFEEETLVFPKGPDDLAEIHILTGPNGSGKSTVLYALANGFLAEEYEGFTREFLLSRFHNLAQNLVQEKEAIELEKDFPNLINIEVEFEKGIDFPSIDNFSHIRDRIILKINSEGKFNPIFGMEVPLPFSTSVKLLQTLITSKNYLSHKFSFSAFAYSNYRQLQAESVQGIFEPKENPLRQALEFAKQYPQGATINQWIANNISKRAAAKEMGDQNIAKKFAQNIQNLESIISQIIGYPITFQLQLDPLNLVFHTGQEQLDFESLPDGLRSLISWIGDLLMRMDQLHWENDLPIFERRFFLFLDEIEVHLHPSWQRKVLPIVQKLFKNAQIFVSTHSPFVAHSVDGAWIHQLDVVDGLAKPRQPIRSDSGQSYSYILKEVFGIEERFGTPAQTELDTFYDLRNQILTAKKEGKVNGLEEKVLNSAKKILAYDSRELSTIVQMELRQLSRLLDLDLFL